MDNRFLKRMFSCLITAGIIMQFGIASLAYEGESSWSLTSQRYSYTVDPDSSVTMTVTPVGIAQDALTYSWYDSNWNLIDGADSYFYTITSVSDSGTYYCVANDSQGGSDTYEFHVYINNYLDFDTYDSVYNVVPGDSVTIELSAVALDTEGITFTWYNVAGEIVQQSASGNLTITPDHTTTYECHLEDKYGNSQIAYIYIIMDNNFTVTADNADISLFSGGTVTLTANISAYDSTGMQFMWYKVTNGCIYETIPNETSASFTTWAMYENTNFVCRATDRFGNYREVSFDVSVTNLYINEQNFPDPVFRSYVSDNFDSDDNGILTQNEIDDVQYIDIIGLDPSQKVSDLTGIEYFTNLIRLNCQKNNITDLDISNNTALKSLVCSENQLTALDTSSNTELTYINCSHNPIEELDLSNNTELEGLSCQYCALTELELSANISLVAFLCDCSPITELSLDNNTQLRSFSCRGTAITELDIRNLPNILAAYTEGTLNILTMDGEEYHCYNYDADGVFTAFSVDPDVTIISGVDVVRPGLREESGKWRYYGDDGNYVTSTWVLIETQYRYFDQDGYMVTGWQKINNVWYKFDDSGVMQTGWQMSGGKWYYLSSSGAMVTDWQKISNRWYFFNASGAMVTGWQQIGGQWYYFVPSGEMQTGWLQIGDNWYHLNSSGAMNTGWQMISGRWYYFNPSGAMVTSWQKIGNNWFYFNTSGSMVSGWQKIGNSWYYFNPSGAMVTGWQQIGGKWYYFYSGGAMAANINIGSYHLGPDGAMT